MPTVESMKTFKNLYPKIHTFENLEIAFHKARKGKRSRPNVAAFETELAQNLLELQDDLANQSYRPGGCDLQRQQRIH